jgi:MoaA/NifB/PqqE/SkfB family radical SAM enzyme
VNDTKRLDPIGKPIGSANSHRPQFKFRAGPCGIHMFDRMTGLNILLDEMRVSSESWATAPRQVSVALTNACDLTCSYCYAPKNRATLDFSRLTAWLSELDSHGCFSVGFGGGEPTLYRQFAELCNYTSSNTSLAVTFTTHAHRLDEHFLADLVGMVHFVRVSMDGVGNTYEALRGRSFTVLRHRLEALRTVAPFGINFVVNARTLNDLENATKLAAELDAAEFLLLPEQPVRGSGGIDDDSVQALRKWVERYSGPVPLTVSVAGAEGLPFCNPLAGETGLRSYAHIDALGFIKRSSYDEVGVAIRSDGVMRALHTLSEHFKGGTI